MSEAKEMLVKYKHLVHLYIHKDDNKERYNTLLEELNLTDEQVTTAIERCKGEPEFRAMSKYSLLFTDFFDKAPAEDQRKVCIILILVILAISVENNKRQ